MKSHRKELAFNVPSRRGFVNITREVEAAVEESGVREGLVLQLLPVPLPRPCKKGEGFFCVSSVVSGRNSAIAGLG